MDNSNKISQLMSQTKTDYDTAKRLLIDQNWDLPTAIKTYNFMSKHASRPPSGPQKNVEPQSQGVIQPLAAPPTLVPISVAHHQTRSTPDVHSHSLNNWVSAKPVTVTSGSSTVGRGLTGGSYLKVDGRPIGSCGPKPSSPNYSERKLKRGLSKTTDNVTLVNAARDVVLHDIMEAGDDHSQHFVDTPEYTFILPDLTQHPQDFRAFLHKDLIETSTLVSLEQAGRLNWWADLDACQRLLPLATTGDGNCLLHAASLGMWGFHDRLLTLRRALFNTLNNGASQGALWRRWRWHQTQTNRQSGLILSEREWTAEWSNLLELASTKPRSNPGGTASCCNGPATKGLMERNSEPEKEEEGELFYESLEEFHVFVLAHVLRRPIIVVADTVLKNSSGEALAPIPFSGIYLPLECLPSECHRSPLMLTYDAAHFSALVPMEELEAMDDAPDKPKLAAAVPLLNPEFNLLPIHFLVDPGSQFVWGQDESDSQKTKNLVIATEKKLEFIKKYIDIVKVPILRQPVINGVETVGEDGRPRSNSWSGIKQTIKRSTSIDSNDSCLSSSSSSKDKGDHANARPKDGSASLDRNSKNSLKKEKEKDKEKRKSKQVQSVMKSFGSLGKTMSKKLKKNFGGISKGIRQMEIDDGKTVMRQTLVVSATQSTKTTSLTSELLQDCDHILCSKLLHKRLEYQEEMICNYVKAARERFQEDRKLRKQQDEEMRRKAEIQRQELEAANRPAQCVNTNCTRLGTISTSYLCQQCFERQKQEELGLERAPTNDVQISPALSEQNLDVRNGGGSGGSVSCYDGVDASLYRKTDTQPNPHNVNNSSFQRQDTLLTSGKSKFYTYANEEQCIPNNQRDCIQQDINSQNISNLQLNNATYFNHDKSTVRLSRSTFFEATTLENEAPRSVGKPGTAVFINNLHESEFSEKFDEECYVTRVNIETQLPSTEGVDLYVAPGVTRGPTVGELRRQQGQQPTLASPKLQVVLPPKQAPSNITRGHSPPVHVVDPMDNDPYTVRAQGGIPAKVLNQHRERCHNAGCEFYGNFETEFLCSECYKLKKVHVSIQTSYRS